MSSPFPGMDPYIENPAIWKDFHGRLINSLSEVLLDLLPENYLALIEEDILLVEPEHRSQKLVIPDITVSSDSPYIGTSMRHGGGTITDVEPVTIANIESLDLPTQRFLQIVRLPERSVVTVIEVVSPTNKGPDGRGAYLDKRSRLLRQNVNIVEIDLLRAGKRIALSEPLPSAQYFMFVSRSDSRPDCQVYGWSVRRKCPPVPVPLLPGDDEVNADLGVAVRMAYDRGRYGRLIHYEEPPPGPPFSVEDSEWIAKVIAGPNLKVQ